MFANYTVRVFTWCATAFRFLTLVPLLVLLVQGLAYEKGLKKYENDSGILPDPVLRKLRENTWQWVSRDLQKVLLL